MANLGGGAEHLFLGEPQWEFIPGGRVRCVQTGHEMPLAAQSTYALTKKCRSALFDAALQKRTPPLNFFDQSPVAKDKIICKLTGVVLNKKEDAVWKHMLGKKFEQKLAEKEAEKEIVRKDVEMTETSSEKLSSSSVEGARNGDKASRKNKEKAPATSREVDREELQEDAKSDESDFWVPPAGARWDFDVGSDDRWSIPSEDDAGHNKSAKINGHSEAVALEDGFNNDNGDTEMLDGEHALVPPEEGEEFVCNGSEDGEAEIRVKRTSTGSGPRSQKKRAKRFKAG